MFEEHIKDLNIEDMFKTPFMLEIVVQVLPIMLNQEYNDAKIKSKILENFPSIGEKIWKLITNPNNNIL